METSTQHLTIRTQYETPLVMGISFIRHGESLGNKLGVVQGHKDFPLSTMGVAQAQQLGANSVQNLRVSHVFSSDLTRSLHTAQIVCGYLLQKPEIITDARLRERSFGTLEGLPLDRFRNELRLAGVQLNQFKPPGGETVADVRDRVVSFFSDLFALMRAFHKEQQKLPPKDPSMLGTPAWLPDFQVPSGKRDVNPTEPEDTYGASVLIFSHGGWIREALIYLEQTYPFCLEIQKKQVLAVSPNCGVTTLVIKLFEKKATISSALWFHQTFHVSDNVPQVRGKLVRNRIKPVSRTISTPLDRSQSVDRVPASTERRLMAQTSHAV